MEVYKVVRQNGTRLGSASVDGWSYAGEFAREYGVGVKTTPPEEYPQAKLFAFSDKECAIKYASGSLLSCQKVFRAETSKVCMAPPHVSTLDYEDIINFWTGMGEFSFMPVPKGTVLCSDITLIEQVWPEAGHE